MQPLRAQGPRWDPERLKEQSVHGGRRWPRRWGDGQAPHARRPWGTQSVSRGADRGLPDSGESARHAPGHVACEVLRDPGRAVSMVLGVRAGERWGQHGVVTHLRGWILQSRVRLREVQARSRAPLQGPPGPVLSRRKGKRVRPAAAPARPVGAPGAGERASGGEGHVQATRSEWATGPLAHQGVLGEPGWGARCCLRLVFLVLMMVSVTTRNLQRHVRPLEDFNL